MPLSQCKTTDAAPPAAVSIYDQKRVVICSQTEVGLTEAPAFVTNSPIFVELANIYFEKMWTMS